MVHQVKGPALSLLWLRVQLWHRFNPWPKRNKQKSGNYLRVMKFLMILWGGGHGMQQLDVRSQFPDQGLNSGHSNEGAKS